MVSFNILSLATELPLVGQSANSDKSKDAESKAVDSAEPQDTDSVKESSVYIQDINGNLWEVDDWDDSVAPNAIAIIANEPKFLMALDQAELQMSDVSKTQFGSYVFSASCPELAVSDYDGAGNTAKMLDAQPNILYAAGYCNAFVFPDGKTKGYLPSLGQLNLVWQNKYKIEAALNKCGGTVMSKYYWSSTFWGTDNEGNRGYWRLRWSDGMVYSSNLFSNNYVRPFADLT